MDVESEATDLEDQILSGPEEYTSNHPNSDVANLLLTGISRIDGVVSKVNERYSKYIDSRHEYQEIYTVKGVNALQSLFLSVKFHRYDSAYRDVRFLLETYLLVRHLNEHKIKASRIHFRHQRELEDVDDLTKLGQRRIGSVDEFYGILKEEKQNLKQYDEGLQSFNFLSNRGAHPHRIEGARLDGSHAVEEERFLLEWGLDLLLGLSVEYAKLYSDTPAFELMGDRLREVFEALDDVYEPQSFIELSFTDDLLFDDSSM